MRGTGRLLPSKQRVARSNRAGRATFRRLFIWLFLSLPVGYWTRTDGGPNAAGAAVLALWLSGSGLYGEDGSATKVYLR